MTSHPALQPPRLAPRQADAHKGSAGRLAIVGGSVGMSGAVRLAGRAALSGGVGLLTLAVPEPVRAEVATDLPDAMTLGCPSVQAGSLAGPARRAILALEGQPSAFVLGPGGGRHPATGGLFRDLARALAGGVVIDADALVALAADGGPAGPTGAPRILTPHPGEAAALLGTDTAGVQADRASAARRLVAQFGGVVVLKGNGTLVADPDGRLVRATVGGPELAVGGTGDVLAGLCGAFLAAGMPPFDAATAAVWIHGTAGARLAGGMGVRPVTATALTTAVAQVVADRERSD